MKGRLGSEFLKDQRYSDGSWKPKVQTSIIYIFTGLVSD
jgi:carbamate kinase